MLVVFLLIGLVVAGPTTVKASHWPEFDIQVLVEGAPLRRYPHKGTVYIEATRGKEYSIRMINRSSGRVAVALSVDGLSAIDARHTDARAARKWVVDSHSSVTIEGWQTSSREARRFYFTTEDDSYGAWLGQRQNLGIISAAFFKEKKRQVSQRPQASAPRKSGNRPSVFSRDSYSVGESAETGSQLKGRHREDLAATGIGKPVHHRVQQIRMELEMPPAAVRTLRYEFREVLVKLGVLPEVTFSESLLRRERAQGFADSGFCPVPGESSP